MRHVNSVGMVTPMISCLNILRSLHGNSLKSQHTDQRRLYLIRSGSCGDQVTSVASDDSGHAPCRPGYQHVPTPKLFGRMLFRYLILVGNKLNNYFLLKWTFHMTLWGGVGWGWGGAGWRWRWVGGVVVGKFHVNILEAKVMSLTSFY